MHVISVDFGPFIDWLGNSQLVPAEFDIAVLCIICTCILTCTNDKCLLSPCLHGSYEIFRRNLNEYQPGGGMAGVW